MHPGAKRCLLYLPARSFGTARILSCPIGRCLFCRLGRAHMQMPGSERRGAGVPEGTPAGFARRVPATLPPERAPRGSVYKPGRDSRGPFPSRKKAFLLEYHEKRGPSRPLFAHIFRYRLRRPSRALARVTSSVYSRFPPMGIPCAIRVALTPKGFSSRAM